MGAIRIVLIAALFSLVSSETKLMTLELAVPDIVSSLLGINQAVQKFRSTGEDALKEVSNTAQDIVMRFNWEGLSNILQLFFTRRVTREPRPMVEEGPGAFKSDILTFPKNLFTNRLKHLLKIKEKEEEKTKDLNAPK